MIRAFALVLTLMATASPVHAAISVIGSSDAHACYEAARAERITPRAIETCNVALADHAMLGSDRVATFVNRGILYVLSTQIERGIADYDRAIAIDASEPDAYLNKALARLRQDGRSDEAVALLTRAIDYGTRVPAIAFYSRGIANEISGNVTQAYADLRHAQELAPGWDAPTRDLARYEVRQP